MRFSMLIQMELIIGGVTISLMNDGFWFRVSRWDEQGYWITWSTKKRFAERLGYEKPVWQIGKGKIGRLAGFFLQSPGWYMREKRNGTDKDKWKESKKARNVS